MPCVVLGGRATLSFWCLGTQVKSEDTHPQRKRSIFFLLGELMGTRRHAETKIFVFLSTPSSWVDWLVGGEFGSVCRELATNSTEEAPTGSKAAAHVISIVGLWAMSKIAQILVMMLPVISCTLSNESGQGYVRLHQVPLLICWHQKALEYIQTRMWRRGIGFSRKRIDNGINNSFRLLNPEKSRLTYGELDQMIMKVIRQTPFLPPNPYIRTKVPKNSKTVLS